MFGLKKKQGSVEKSGTFSRLRRSLTKTHDVLTTNFDTLLKNQIDDEILDHLETCLLTADAGVNATAEFIKSLRIRANRKDMNNDETLRQHLHQLLVERLASVEQPLQIRTEHRPFVILVTGVNGVGKTTTIGKLAKNFQANGNKVMLAAADTFRAAAVEQLQIWGKRNNVPVIAQGSGADPASVTYDAMAAAQARRVDVLLVDTAGRLHTQENLMQELAKIKRIITKLDSTAPHEILLVLDAGSGQNALLQTRQFHQTVNLTGLVITKLDGTAKGGMLFAIANEFDLPVRYIGVGEEIDDLQPFCAADFVCALLQEDKPAAANLSANTATEQRSLDT